MQRRTYELYIYNNKMLGDCIAKFSTMKSVDEYISSHTEHRYLVINKPYIKKIRYNCLGGKEIY